jgi:chaperonin GroES
VGSAETFRTLSVVGQNPGLPSGGRPKNEQVFFGTIFPQDSVCGQTPAERLARRASTCEGEAMATATASVTTTFTPLHDRILVRRIEEGESVRGGIIIPDSAKEKPQEGEVISVGKGKSNDEGKVFPLDVKKGDRVLFGKYSGTEIKIDGEELLIMREEEVLGILKK